MIENQTSYLKRNPDNSSSVNEEIEQLKSSIDNLQSQITSLKNAPHPFNRRKNFVINENTNLMNLPLGNGNIDTPEFNLSFKKLKDSVKVYNGNNNNQTTYTSKNVTLTLVNEDNGYYLRRDDGKSYVAMLNLS